MTSGWDELANLLPTIYQDLAKPSAIKAGKALAFITGLITTPLEKREAIRDKNLKIFFKKLEAEKEEDIIEAPPELAVPIMEKLRHVRSEELVGLYTELLLKASLKDFQNQAHPAYFEVINCLSGDEAKLLQILHQKKNYQIPYLELRLRTAADKTDYHILSRFFTDLNRDEGLTYPKNMNMYIENFIRLGILEDKGDTYLEDAPAYQKLYDNLEYAKYLENSKKDGHILDPKKSALQVTQFGKNFMETCIPKF